MLIENPVVYHFLKMSEFTTFIEAEEWLLIGNCTKISRHDWA